MEKININLSKSQEKKLPSNLEAEQAVIGSVLVNNDIIDEISNFINHQKSSRCIKNHSYVFLTIPRHH